MNLLEERNNEYFDRYQDRLFVFYTVDPIMKIAKIEKYNGNWWLTYPGIHIKATTVKCVVLDALAGRRVQYYGYISEKQWNLYPEIQGSIVGGYALKNSANIGVFWDHGVTGGKVPTPWFWSNINDLKFL